MVDDGGGVAATMVEVQWQCCRGEVEEKGRKRVIYVVKIKENGRSKEEDDKEG